MANIGNADTSPLDALRTLARQLHAEGLAPLDITWRLLRADRRPGDSAPSVASIVRETIGEPAWNAVEAVASQPTEGSLADGIFEDPVTGYTLPDQTPEAVRRRKRGERLAARLREYRQQLAPALVEALREPLTALIRDVLEAELPPALDVLRPVRRKGASA